MTKVTELAKMIDHSVLQPFYTDRDLEEQCEVALKYDVASVCVKPYAVKKAAELLSGSAVAVGCVIGFPHGNSAISVKTFEAERACRDGATEIDMVVNIGKVLSADWHYVENEISSVTRICHRHKAIVKVIFETDFVTSREDKIRLCKICTKVNADFVKTSTGYGFVKQKDGSYSYTGATVEDVKLMKEHVGPKVRVKSAGGVRTLDELLKMKEAGATRSGASATVAILEEAKKRFGKS